MANKRDYYEVLGVEKNATDDDIKRAFRRKAKECHPDLHPNDKEAEERFKELNEANEVLSDPDKRARYDQFGFEDPMGGMGGGNPFGGMDFGGMGGMGDILEQMFGMGGMGGMGGQRRNAPRQGADVRYDLRISFEEAAKGCTKSVEFYRSENCTTCKGSGAKPGTQPETCTMCKGAGQIRQSNGWMSTVRTCPGCGGAGKVIKEKCTGCGGTGRTRVKRTLDLKVPAGVDDSIVLTKRGEGEPGVNGGPNGDLNIRIVVRPHKLFRREGINLRLEVPISFTQAALGAEIDVPTLDGSQVPDSRGHPDGHRVPHPRPGHPAAGRPDEGRSDLPRARGDPQALVRQAARPPPPVRRSVHRQGVRAEEVLPG